MTWEGGRWIQKSLGSIGSAALTQIYSGSPNMYQQDVLVTVGKDFFGIYNKAACLLYLFKKNDKIAGDWYSYTTATQCQGTTPTLLSGDNFIFIGSIDNSVTINRAYYYDPSSSSASAWSYIPISKPSGNSQCFYAVSDNLIVTHGNRTSGTDELKIDYLTPSATTPTWTSSSLQIPQANATHLYASNTQVLMITNNGNERIYNWSPQYVINSGFDTGTNEADNSHVVNSNSGLTLISNQTRGFGLRFDGLSWVSSGNIDFNGPSVYFRNTFSLGEDLVLRPRPSGHVGAKVFDPNVNTWSDPASLDITPSVNAFVLLAGNNYVTVDGKFYFRSPSGSWTQDPTVITALQQSGTDYFLQGGLDFVTTGVAGSNNSIAVNFKNGKLPTAPDNPLISFGPTPDAEQIKDRPSGFSLSTSEQASYNTVVTFLDGVGTMEDATRLKFHRKINDSFSEIIGGTQVESISAWVAWRKDSYDGDQTLPTYYDYNLSTASVGQNAVPQFNRARTIIGTADGSSKPYGYTDTYFFNQLYATLLTTYDPTAALPGEAANVFNKLTGATYKMRSFDSQSTLLSDNITDYRYFDILSTYLVGKGSFAKPITQVVTNYSPVAVPATKTINFSYNAGSSTQLGGKSSYGNESSNPQNETTGYYSTYYGTLSNAGIPVLKMNTRGSSVTSLVATRWKTFGAVSAPYQTYEWRSGSTDFSSYFNAANAVPTANWFLKKTIVDYDPRGLQREVINSEGIRKVSVYHPLKPILLAEAFRASFNQVLYEGFENTTSGISTDAVAGASSLIGTYTVVLPSAGTYKLTYWQKTGSGSWQLMTQTVSSNTSIGGSGILLDEVRLHPPLAMMTSYSYDKFGNVVTVCDSNNQITYFEYDEFSRKKLVRDQDKNIVRYNSVNIKN